VKPYSQSFGDVFTDGRYEPLAAEPVSPERGSLAVRDRPVDAVDGPVDIVEQSVRALLDHCDYVYVIDRGTTVFDGEAQEIRERDDLMDMYLALEVD